MPLNCISAKQKRMVSPAYVDNLLEIKFVNFKGECNGSLAQFSVPMPSMDLLELVSRHEKVLFPSAVI